MFENSSTHQASSLNVLAWRDGSSSFIM